MRRLLDEYRGVVEPVCSVASASGPTTLRQRNSRLERLSQIERMDSPWDHDPSAPEEDESVRWIPRSISSFGLRTRRSPDSLV